MAPTNLNPGDIAFLSLIADNPDTFSFVLLKDIEAGTIINVTDNGWSSSGAFRTGEGVLQYVAPTAQTAGTVITYVDGSTNTGWTNISGGTSFALSTSGDSLIAFQGPLSGTGSATTSTSPTLLAALTINRSTFDANAIDSNTTALPTGLTVGVNAVAVGKATAEWDDARYTGPTSFTSVEQARTAINTASNWTGSDTDTTNFSGIFTIGATATPPTVNLSVSTNIGSEVGQTAITVTATASSAVTGDQTVNLNVGGTGVTAGDYTLSNTVITIPNGATSGSVTFTVADDVLIEGTETANLSLSNPSAGITLGNTTSQSVSIVDNDGNASLVSTITVPGNATDLFPVSGGANVNRLGGFGSDFFYDYRTGFYYGVADRGPGGGTIPYPTRVEKFALTVDPNTGAASGFQVVQTIPFYIPAGTMLNGVTYTTDTPFNGLNSKLLADGGNGSLLTESQDPEGFVVGANGNFFVSDEYGPSIYEFEPTGKFVRAFTPPANVLPKLNGAPYYAADVSSTTGRQDNRGYEGLAISPDGTKLFAVFQDPLQEEGSGGSNPGRNSRNVRIVRYDVATGQSDAQYIYQLESLSDINDRIPGTTNDFSPTAQGRNIGISSLVAINNTELLVLERDNRGIGVDDPSGKLPIGSKRVYKINLTGATDVSNISLAGTNTLPENVTPVGKSLFLDIAGALQSAGQTIPEKIEGLALGPQLADGSFALLVATDNDFSVTQNSSGKQFDVYTDGTQQLIDSAPPASGATLLPSYVYAFRTQPNALDVTPIFDFSTGNYSVTEGNTPGFSTNATVRITRRGDLDGINTVQLKLSGGTATGSGLPAPAQSTVQGPSTGSTPYILPVASGVRVISLLTTDNTGANPDDTVPKVGGGTYGMDGIPDGLGAFDNGDGTFTVLMNHELGSSNGVVRDHGAKGAYVSKFVIDKSTLQVISGEDLIKQIYGWNSATQSVDTTAPITLAINRLCSADLPAVTAFYNPNTGLGTQARIFMNGEEGGATGYQFATVVTGSDAGKAYVLGKFNLATNGSGATGVGGWENALANPYAQDKTIVVGNNDGGTGIMNNAVAVYVGTKQNTGTEVDKAGLTNGTLKFINVVGNLKEIANDTTRATNITSGTRFTLSSDSSTTFSRPEDGAWNPLDPRQYFFATTDRIDQVSDGVGTQIGQTRLWRLTFDDITNPDAGGTIDLLVDGDTVNGVKVNMFDNITIDKYGHILLQEDVGGAAHNGKIWQYDIATDTLKQLAKHDPARFGDVGVAATSPFNSDEESSGIIDVQDILGPGWFLTSDQAHYTTGVTTSQVEGGQLLAIFNPDTYNAAAVDYNSTPITVTFNPGETFKEVQIPVAGDFTPEPNETINLSLVNPSAGTVIGTKQPNAVLTINNDDQPPSARIHDIQGAAHTSPLNGQSVTNVPGIVTAIASNGFYLQDPNPDKNDATSEGIFVFTSSRPTVAVGDSVQVSGKVSEFRPGNNANNLTTTEIISSTINKLSSGNALPVATILGSEGRAIPASVIEDDASNVENNDTFDPAQDGIDFYESLEGMRVQINTPVTTSPTNDFGELWVLANNGTNATSKTARGGSLINPTDFNPERIQIDDSLFSGGMPKVNVGTQLGTIVGVVDYNFGNYEVLPTTTPTVVTPSSLTKEVTSLVGDPNRLTVATFNVENLDPGDGAVKFNALASAIVTNLKSPDIISLEEIQDNNGATNDSVVDASVTYQTLINAIAAAGGPTYQYRQINPVDDTNGGEPGGNIRVGFLYNPQRVTFVDRPGGTSTSNTTVTDVRNDGIPDLSASPGLIDPTNSAFNASRKPLVGEFVFNGQTVYVIGNHFNSKGGDQPLFGPNQPPTLSSEVQRNQQATIVKNFVQNILAINPNANVIVAGDLNDFEFSNPLNILKSGGLNNLIETLPANERYTYNFEGNAQTLDHILVSKNLLNQLNGFDVVHINSEFADQVSDHDPSVARFLFNSAPTALALGTTSIDENVSANTIVGTFSTTDPDPGNTFNYSLVSGTGDTDNTQFTINSNQLQINFSPDFETKSTYSIRVRTTDQGGLSLDKVLTIAINDRNDAPVLNSIQVQNFAAIDEDPTTNSGMPLSTILANAVADQDAGALQGIAVTGTTGSGSWQYSTNSGASWTDFGNVNDNSALLLDANTLVRFNPSLDYNGTVNFNFRAWDQTSGTTGNKVDTSLNGRSTAFSKESAVSSLTINPVNDAPVNTVPGVQTAIQDSFLAFSPTKGNAISINDVDANGSVEQVNLSVNNGFLSLGNTNGLTVINGSNNSAAITVQGTLTDLNNALNELKFTPDAPSVINGSVTLTIQTNDLGNTGAGGAKTDTDTITIAIKPANLIRGTVKNGTLQGTDGADAIYAGSGNYKIYGNGGNDILLGGDGNDELYGGAGNDYIDGGNGNDKIYAYGGNNTIYGRAGNDTIYVGSGTNFIDGGLGNDTIYLSSGQDTIALTRGSGIDTIYNYSAGSTRFNLTAGLTYSDLTVLQDGSNTLIRAGSEKLASLIGVQASGITSGSFLGV